jgi:hypothetical protein
MSTKSYARLARRSVAIVLILVLGLSPVLPASAQDAGDAPALPNIYRSTAPVFTIAYPRGWGVTELGPDSVLLAAPSNLSFLFTMRQDNFYFDEDLDLSTAMTDSMVAGMLASPDCTNSQVGERGEFVANNAKWITVEATCAIDASFTMQAIIYISAQPAEDAIYLFMGATMDLLFPTQRPTYDAMVASVTFPDAASAAPAATDDAGSGSAIAEIEVNTLNVRQGPGTSYAVLGVVHRGDRCPVVGQEKNGWLPITTPDGQAGWISGDAQFVTFIPLAPPQLVQHIDPTPTPTPIRRPQIQPTASSTPTSSSEGAVVQVTLIYPETTGAQGATYAWLSYYARTTGEWVNQMLLTDADNRATFEIPIEPDGNSAVFTPALSIGAIKEITESITVGRSLGFRIAAKDVGKEIVLRLESSGNLQIESGTLQLWSIDE